MGWSLGERRCHATPRRAFGWLIPIVATGRSARGVPGDPRIATRPHHPPARRVPVAPALESRDQQPLFALSRSSHAPRSPPPHARFARARHALGSSTRERGWRERLTCRPRRLSARRPRRLSAAPSPHAVCAAGRLRAPSAPSAPSLRAPSPRAVCARRPCRLRAPSAPSLRAVSAPSLRAVSAPPPRRLPAPSAPSLRAPSAPCLRTLPPRAVSPRAVSARRPRRLRAPSAPSLRAVCASPRAVRPAPPRAVPARRRTGVSVAVNLFLPPGPWHKTRISPHPRFISPQFPRTLPSFYSPPRTSTSGRRPGVRAKRAARGVAGRQVWTGRREKTAHPSIAIMNRMPLNFLCARFSLPKCHFHPDLPVF